MKMMSPTKLHKRKLVDEVYNKMINGFSKKDIAVILDEKCSVNGKPLSEKNKLSIMKEADKKFLKTSVDDENINRAKAVAILEELYKYCVADKKLDTALKVLKEKHIIQGLVDKSTKVNKNTLNINSLSNLSDEELMKLKSQYTAVVSDVTKK